MSDKIRSWDSVRRRWMPDSHVWDGLKTIPIETARNEVLDLCDGIDQLRAALAAATQRADAAEADRNIFYGEATRANARENDAIKRNAAVEAALAAATAERDHARRHVELLREELDAVPVAALDALADSAAAVPAKIIEWLAWSTLGAHWQPADSPCPDCGANALAVAIHADGTIEQWLCDACGYVAAEKSKVQLCAD